MSTIQDSLTRQQFSMIKSSLLQSLRIACRYTVFPSRSSQLPTIPIQRLLQCNRLQCYADSKTLQLLLMR